MGISQKWERKRRVGLRFRRVVRDGSSEKMKRVGLAELRRVVVEEKKRLLGFDVGIKYLGISVSDQRCRIAIPLRY